MRKVLLLVPLLLCAGASASAQSAFKGFYATAGVGIDYIAPSADEVTLVIKNGPLAGTYPRTTTYPRSFDPTGTFAVGSLSAITKKFLLGIGVEMELIKMATDTVETVGARGIIDYSTYRQTSHFNVFLSPAYAVTEDKLVYGKIGYSMSRSEADFDGVHSPDHEAAGYIVGAGYRQIVRGGLFFFGEANYFHYNPKDYIVNTITSQGVLYFSDQKISSQGTNAMVGIGYTLPRSLTGK